MKLRLTQTYTATTSRHKCAECGRFCKLGRLTKKTPLARCEMPSAICVECKTKADEEYRKFLDAMVECADCSYGIIPSQISGDLCDDCIENRNYWLEMEEDEHLSALRGADSAV